ncbi:hypothetical protein Scep_009948 [Stephania cephalantha]|uniref:Uncharacterized protein n=1 Tax=Stephania cephalantha TaxID=152367 RepID=A0AAP0JWK9_9MAGN
MCTRHLTLKSHGFQRGSLLQNPLESTASSDFVESHPSSMIDRSDNSHRTVAPRRSPRRRQKLATAKIAMLPEPLAAAAAAQVPTVTAAVSSSASSVAVAPPPGAGTAVRTARRLSCAAGSPLRHLPRPPRRCEPLSSALPIRRDCSPSRSPGSLLHWSSAAAPLDSSARLQLVVRGFASTAAATARLAGLAAPELCREQKTNINGAVQEIRRHERKLSFFGNLGSGLWCVTKLAVGFGVLTC